MPRNAYPACCAPKHCAWLMPRSAPTIPCVDAIKARRVCSLSLSLSLNNQKQNCSCNQQLLGPINREHRVGCAKGRCILAFARCLVDYGPPDCILALLANPNVCAGNCRRRQQCIQAASPPIPQPPTRCFWALPSGVNTRTNCCAKHNVRRCIVLGLTLTVPLFFFFGKTRSFTRTHMRTYTHNTKRWQGLL